MEITTLVGIIVGLGGVFLGNFLEGGNASSLIQVTAAFIVFGGTFGATMVSNAWGDVRLAISQFKICFAKSNSEEFDKVGKDIVLAAQMARKESVLTLEKRIGEFSNPYMRDVFRFMIDGVDPEILRDVFESKIHYEEERQLAGARVWMDAGGFAPTIGIIGAVLGLIHVMANLTNTSALGHGIAVAFVATIYGVASANLIFIPIANKIKRKIEGQSQLKRMIVDGAVAISSGLNPYIVQEKMNSYSIQKGLSEE